MDNENVIKLSSGQYHSKSGRFATLETEKQTWISAICSTE